MTDTSQWVGYDYPWGTLPEIDENVRCSNVSVDHDAYNMTRQDKLNHIVAKCHEENFPPPQMAVCSRPYTVTLNCERCEKCLRTMTGIIVAGGDPRDFGFSFAAKGVWELVQQAFDRFQLTMFESDLYYWQDIRDHAKTALAGCGGNVCHKDTRDYLGWLAGRNLKAIHNHSSIAVDGRSMLSALLSWNPFLFEFVKMSLKNAAGVATSLACPQVATSSTLKLKVRFVVALRS